MDLDPAAVEAAAKAIKDKLIPFTRDMGYIIANNLGWGASCEELAAAAIIAAYPIIAEAAEAATREATAREVAIAARSLYIESFQKPTDSPFEHGVRAGIDQVYAVAARIVNERCSTAPEGQKP